MKKPMCKTLECRRAPEDEQLRALGDRFRHRCRERTRILHRPVEADQVAPDPKGDPVEHDRGDHLVGAHGRLEDAGDAGPQRSRDCRRGHHEDHMQGARHSGEPDPELDADERADRVLAVPSDVEEAAAEREGDREAGQHQRTATGSGSAAGWWRRSSPSPTGTRLASVNGSPMLCEPTRKNQIKPVPSKIARYVESGFCAVVSEDHETADQEGEEAVRSGVDDTARSLVEARRAATAGGRSRGEDAGADRRRSDLSRSRQPPRRGRPSSRSRALPRSRREGTRRRGRPS